MLRMSPSSVGGWGEGLAIFKCLLWLTTASVVSCCALYKRSRVRGDDGLGSGTMDKRGSSEKGGKAGQRVER